jgi:flagellin
MGLRINTNTISVKAQRNLGVNTNAMNRALERLTSGQRINNAGDDAAGLAISEGLRSQIRGNQQAIRNANDGFGFLATADGALGELTNISQRIRELSLQAATGSVSASDRQNLNSEVQQLLSEFDRIATDTEFNGARLLDGSFTTTELQVGIRKGQTISFNIGNARTTQIGAQALYSGAQNAIRSGVNGLVLNGIGIANSASDGVSSVGAAKSALAVANAINNKSGETKVSADVLDTNVTLFDLTFASSYDLASGQFEINGVSITGDDIDNVNTLIDRINLKSSFTGVKASLVDGTTEDVVLTAQDGRNIQVNFHGGNSFINVLADSDNTAAGGIFAGAAAMFAASSNLSDVGFSGIVVTGSVTAGNVLSTGIETVSGAFVSTDGFVRTGAVQLRASEEIEVAGSNVSQSLGFVAGTVEVSNATALDSVDISSQSGAADALAITDSVIRTLTNLRAGLGAIQSRLQTSIANLSITSENLSAAQSQIRDADIAVETAELTRAQILQQAGVAVLGQANVSAQTALSLLRFG